MGAGIYRHEVGDERALRKRICDPLCLAHYAATGCHESSLRIGGGHCAAENIQPQTPTRYSSAAGNMDRSDNAHSGENVAGPGATCVEVIQSIHKINL